MMDDIHAELADLRARVERLEQRAKAYKEGEHPLAERVEAKFEQASEEARRFPIGEVRALSYFRFSRPGDDEYGRLLDEKTIGLDALLALSSDEAAHSMAGMAHPIRLEIYKALLTGSKDSASLLEAAGLNTTGQLYHHLREMEEVGLVVRYGRNRWGQANLQAFALALVAAQQLMRWRGEGREGRG